MKRILRFYFFAESLNGALDNLILKLAVSPLCDAETCAERIAELISRKCALNGLWLYLDGVLSVFGKEEREALEGYCGARHGLKLFGKEEQKAIKRAAVKFTRRARRLESFGEEIKILSEYYCLLGGRT